MSIHCALISIRCHYNVVTMKKEFLQIRVSEAEKAALNELALELDKPASVIVRDAIKEKVAESRPRRKKKVETA